MPVVVDGRDRRGSGGGIALQHPIDERLPVDGVLHGLAHLRIEHGGVRGALRVVDHVERELPEGLGARFRRADPGPALHRLVQVGRGDHRVIDRALQQGLHHGFVRVVVAEHDLVDRRRALPVVGSRGHRPVLPLLPLGEVERTGDDRVGVVLELLDLLDAHLAPDVFGQDQAVAGEPGHQRGTRRLPHDRSVVGGLDAVGEPVAVAPRADVVGHDEVGGPHEVVRRQGHAVAPRQPLAQMEGPGQPVGGDPAVLLGWAPRWRAPARWRSPSGPAGPTRRTSGPTTKDSLESICLKGLAELRSPVTPSVNTTGSSPGEGEG